MVKLRYYQNEAVEAMLNTTDNGVVVLPTASGKSLVIRSFVEKTDKRVLIISHVREILEQDFECLAGVPDVGLYSAGLNMAVIGKHTVAGIQSIWRKPDMFRDFDVVLIDEAHLVSDEGMYKTFLEELGVQYIGLTATDYRLKGGRIHGPTGMFDSCIYEAEVGKLTKEGYLCPLTHIGDVEAFDTEGIRTTGGDFNLKDMSAKFNRSGITRQIVDRLVKVDRKHILIFCIDIDHAEEVAKYFNLAGISAAAVHSKSPRDQALLDFKSGKIQVLTNVNVLTTGFNYPELDMIAILRPTKSQSLWVQMLGRGARMHPSKSHTLVKDFTNNTKTLGTLEFQADINEKEKKGVGGEAIMKECPECLLLVHASVRVCSCGHKFKFEHNLKAIAQDAPEKLPKWHDVTDVKYNLHNKPNSPVSLKVSYVCGVRVFNEWVLLDHGGFARHKANHWVARRWKYKTKAPHTVKQLHEHSSLLWKPRRIQVDDRAKFPKILSSI